MLITTTDLNSRCVMNKVILPDNILVGQTHAKYYYKPFHTYLDLRQLSSGCRCTAPRQLAFSLQLVYSSVEVLGFLLSYGACRILTPLA